MAAAVCTAAAAAAVAPAAAAAVATGEPVIRNCKISFRLSGEIDLPGRLQRTASSIKFFHNFAVIRSNFVYTVFMSGFVNATKIGTLADCSRAVDHLLSILDVGRDALQGAFSVDNITAAGHFPRRIRLSAVKTIPGMHVRFKPDRFAGLSIRFDNVRGTIIVFKSGSYTIVGAKTADDVNRAFCRVEEYLQTY